MQWIVLLARINAYLPRTHGEKSHLNIMAINVEAKSWDEAHNKAMELLGEDRKWLTLDIIKYNPEIDDNISAYIDEVELQEPTGDPYG